MIVNERKGMLRLNIRVIFTKFSILFVFFHNQIVVHHIIPCCRDSQGGKKKRKIETK